MGFPSFACVYPLFILTMSPLAGENYPVTSVSPCPENIIAMSKEVTKWTHSEAPEFPGWSTVFAHVIRSLPTRGCSGPTVD